MKIILSTIILLSSTIALGQNTGIGIKAAYTRTNSTSYLGFNDGAGSYSTGITGSKAISKKHYIGAELLLENRRFSPNVNYTDKNGKSISVEDFSTFNYLSIPLKIGLKSSGKVYVFGALGVIPALLISANQKTFLNTNDYQKIKTTIYYD